MLRSLLLSIVFTLAVLSTKSQSPVINSVDTCVNKYFIKFYNSSGHSLEVGSIVFDNNSIITCGAVRLSNTNNNLDGYLMKTDADGTIIWQKTFGGIGSQGLRKLIKLADGNFVATGVDATNNNIQYYLLKFDTNGAIIWRKDFGTTNNIENISVSEIAEDVNGDLIITAFNIENDPFAHFRILFSRFNKFGNIILSRFYVPPYNAYAALMFPNNCIIKDGYTYIAGNVWINSLKGLLMKIDNASGNLQWSKIYDFNSGEADFSQVINYANDKLCLIGVNKLSPKDTSIIYLVDTSGKPSSVKYFQFPNLSNGEPGIYGTAMLDKDKNLVWTMKNVSMLRSNMTISKVNPLNGVLWAKDYQQLINMPRPTAIVFGADSSIYTGGYNAGITGHSQFYLSKFSKDAASGCDPVNLNTTFGDGVSNVENVSFVLENNKSIIQKNGSDNIIGNYLLLTDSSCTISNLCTTIKLSGPGMLCNIADTIDVQLSKNNECTLLPVLEFDTLKVRLLSFSGSVAKFMPLKTGIFSVKVSLHTSCRIFSDSVSINIAIPASMLDVGKDTAICAGSNLRLSAGREFSSYKWQNGSTDSFFIATSPGKYYVTVIDYCDISKTDTITLLPAAEVSFNFLPLYSKCGLDTVFFSIPPQLSGFSFDPPGNIKYSNNEIKAWPVTGVNFSVKATTYFGCLISDSLRIKVHGLAAGYLPNDTAICAGNNLLIKAQDGFNNYTWNNGSHLKEMNTSLADTYWLNVIDKNGCSSRDTILISVNPTPGLFLGNDTAICPGEKHTIKPGSQYVSYLWQDGSESINYFTNQLGAYWVKVTDNKGCTNADTINIIAYKAIPVNFLKKTDSICIFDSKNIYAIGNWSAYLWSNGVSTSFINVTAPGSYTLQVTNSLGCSAKDTIQILNYECVKGIWFPSAFTPNDDGKNDLFKPIVHIPVDDYYLEIYNRYGQRIFRETNPAKGWDGRFKLEMQNTGVYIWYCVFRLQGDEKKKQKGTVVLIR